MVEILPAPWHSQPPDSLQSPSERCTTLNNEMSHSLAGFAVLMLLLTSCMPSAIKDQESFNRQHLSNSARIEHLNIQHGPQRMHAAIVKGLTAQARLSAVLFIHGTPGDWTGASRFLLSDELRKITTVVSIDRPGWGESKSQDSEWREQVLFTEQAKGIAAVLTALRSKHEVDHIILVGHSLGASIAPQVAIDYPHLVDGMLLLAGSLNPELGGPRWFNRLANLPGVHYLLPEMLDRSNREIMALRDNLNAMQAGWQQLSLPIVVIQGMSDELVYPANIEYVEAHPNANSRIKAVRLENAGHLLHLEQQELVIATLKQLLEAGDAGAGSSLPAGTQM